MHDVSSGAASPLDPSDLTVCSTKPVYWTRSLDECDGFQFGTNLVLVDINVGSEPSGLSEFTEFDICDF